MSNGSVQFPQPPGWVRLHHIGYVLASIEQGARDFARSLGASWDGKIVFDPLQKVRVSFLQGAVAADAPIELIEPCGPESPVARFLEHGGGLHHLCYEVEALEAHLAFCKSVGTIVIRRPAPAVAFEGRHIAWVITKERLLVEFLETSLAPDACGYSRRSLSLSEAYEERAESLAHLRARASYRFLQFRPPLAKFS